MANSNQGDARFVNWVHPLNSSLPPKGPSVVMDAATAFPFSAACTGVRNNNSNGAGGSSSSTKQHHHRTPSAGFVPQVPVSWIDDMLDSPEAPARKTHHRRSASDTAAFLELPESSSKQLPEELRRDEDFAYRNLTCGAAVLQGRTSDFERLDDEQIMSMFGTECDPSQRSTASRSGMVSSGATGGSESLDKKLCSDVPTSPSDSNSGNEMSIEEVRPGPLNCPKTEPEEVQSVNAGEVPTTITPPTTTGKQPTASSHIDPNMDPKRAKRILANRQSAQRSRVRKLQYIAELERSVTALQTEVSALTPQVAFLDHQRILLNVDNNTIKQRIASLMQDKRFKDAHNEALTREVHRLRQVLQQQEELRSQFHHYNNSSLPPNSTAEVPENEGKQDAFGLKTGCGAAAVAATVDRAAQGSTTTNGLLGENGTDHLVTGHHGSEV